MLQINALFETYIFGKYDDIINDYDEGEVFSLYLLLVNEDFIHYVYINGYGEIMESQVMFVWYFQFTGLEKSGVEKIKMMGIIDKKLIRILFVQKIIQ
ncbi:hypothetical protein D3Z36_16960 [Lachnospiraceae bacterium]|nr:hypothetical protein [Lachnospiraceae bacterium]